MSQVLDVCVTLFCLSLSSFLYQSRHPLVGGTHTCPQGYLLHNQVTHARLLPLKAANAFTYPTLALLVSLKALEEHSLDLGRGWIFGYGGLWGRVVGLRPDPYLTNQTGSIRNKLVALLKARGYMEERHSLQDAWMMTMPSFLGFEGINPLTVYFCYNAEGTFWATLLEIHNTFGESHVHVLELGQNEEPPSHGYDHQWTFRREFHVSPFNDRSGFYTVSVKSPTHPPMPVFQEASQKPVPPRPSVRVHLYTASEDEFHRKGQLKLTALLRPTHSSPLTTPTLLLSLAQAPFSLLLTLPRILFVAWELHYQKRLDVFLRPEPLPGVSDWNASKPFGGVRWLGEGLLDQLVRNRVERFLRRRTRETGIEVALIAADPSIPRQRFSPDQTTSSQLSIFYLSSRMFSILFLSPSAEHALLLGADTEKIFRVSSKEQFLNVFLTASPIPSPEVSWLQGIRSRGLPQHLALSVPPSHFLDQPGLISTICSGLILYTHRFLDSFEKSIFSMTRARVVEGQEPWKQWDRAAAKLLTGDSSTSSLSRVDTIGSIIRDR